MERPPLPTLLVVSVATYMGDCYENDRYNPLIVIPAKERNPPLPSRERAGVRVMSVAVSYFTYPLTPSRGDPLHYPLALEGEA